MKKIFTYLVVFLIGFTIGAIGAIGLCSRRTSSTRRPVFSDSITKTRYKTKVDTFFKSVPLPYICKVVDTLTLPSPDSMCTHIIEQKEYKDSTYNAWISGCYATLDSIKVFGKTEYIESITTVTQTKYIDDTRYKIYVGASIQRYEKDYIPSITFYCSKKDFLVGVMAGIYNSKPIYGVNINYKIK